MTKDLFWEWVLLNISKYNLNDKQLYRFYELEDRTPKKPLIIDSKIVEPYKPF